MVVKVELVGDGIGGEERQGAAGQAGIQEGDILLAIDGEPVVTMEDLNRILFSHEVGDTITVTIYRGGKQGSARLTIQEDKN